MQYTLRNVSPHIDSALRRRARQEQKSLNRVAIEALARGAGLSDEPVANRSLADLAGSWKEDPAIDGALADQREVDSDLWR